LAWPESHGFGLALCGFGLVKLQARPKHLALARLGPALAWAMALPSNFQFHKITGLMSLEVIERDYKSSFSVLYTVKHQTESITLKLCSAITDYF
jgi:hypothetical protein